MTIDEAIELERQVAKLDQIAKWLKESKTLKENSVSKEAFEKMKTRAYKKGHRQGYSKAIDDVLKLPKYTIYDSSNESMSITISIYDILKLKETINE